MGLYPWVGMGGTSPLSGDLWDMGYHPWVGMVGISLLGEWVGLHPWVGMDGTSPLGGMSSLGDDR